MCGGSLDGESGQKIMLVVQDCGVLGHTLSSVFIFKLKATLFTHMISGMTEQHMCAGKLGWGEWAEGYAYADYAG